MELGVISVRYARAFLKYATNISVETLVYQEMQLLYDCYLQVSELRSTIDNPMLSKDKKEQLLVTACGTNVTEATQSFIRLILKEGREKALQFMAASYITLYRKQKNITCGKLSTATVVAPAVEQKMRLLVESRTLGTVEFNTEVNPEIIGGFILEYDTYRMDASVKTRLSSILSQLKQ
ncbi:ATP synthase F1, delta subunit [Prevotella sp. DNF00663]|uniref:F0F1 ATP synthase subunit delta n=1 Tax=unclassified Prevotella TaxID=2638335 RepID=UPI000512E1D0|nr:MULTISPECIES: F0F1 ATP synthase subunit delta [unclassified Prevotella]KGI60560.1 ATP synthase F0F1 subunit delta [Prevotella sp. S7 MS 2]KXB85699.1 ATP synthase F1, delta subunit [Prevotella sp. DNF00663]